MFLQHSKMFRLSCIVLLLASFVITFTDCNSYADDKEEYYERATQYFKDGKLEDAMLEVRNALKDDNRYVAALDLKGNIHFEKQQWQDAFNAWSQALEVDPTLESAKLGLAKLYLLSNNLEKAEESVNEILQNSPDQAEARILLAAIRTKQEKYDEAETILKEVMQQEPGNENVYPLLANVYKAQGRNDEAISLLEKGVEAVEKNLVLRLQLVNFYAENEDYNKAEAILLSLHEKHPDDAIFLQYLVKLYIQMGQPEKGLELLTAALQEKPDDQTLRTQVAELYELQGDIDKAIALLQEGISEGEADYPLRFKMADLELKKGNIDKAREIYNTIISLDEEAPRALDARRGLAQILLQEGKQDEALAELNTILEKNPEDVMTLYIKGRILMSRGEFNEAILLLRQVVFEKPDLGDAYSLMAQAHYLLDEPTMAEVVLRDALDRNPNYYPARMELMRLYARMEEPDSAAEQAEELAKFAAKNNVPQDVIIFLGDYFLQAGQPEKAEAFFKRLIDKEQTAPVGYFRLGRLYTVQGDSAKALGILRKGLEKTPDNALLNEAMVMVNLQNNDPKAARAFLDEQMKKYPDNPVLFELQARIDQFEGNTDAAVNDYMQAIKANPKWALPYSRLASLYSNSGRLAEGIETFSKIYADNPDFKGLGFLIAVLRQMNGDLAEAEQGYRDVLADQKEFVPAKNNLAYLMTEHNPTPERLQEALELAQQAVNDGKNANTLDTLGVVQMALGDDAKALTNLDEAYKLAAENPEIAYHYALALEQTGAQDTAKDVIEKFDASKHEEPLAGKIKSLQDKLKTPAQ